LKSNVSDFLKLAEVVYLDATAKCSADVSDLRDLMTMRSRAKKEGISFFTITLPQFCKDFERSLEKGTIDSTLFRMFRKTGSIPVFLQGMVSQLFSRETGELYDDITLDGPSNGHFARSYNSIAVIEAIRQICLLFKKIELQCTPAREYSAIEGYIAIERDFNTFDTTDLAASFRSTSELVWRNLLAPFRVSDITCKHGPGATAERVSGNQKYLWRLWHDRLEPYFPIVHSGYPLGTPSDSMELHNVSIVPVQEEQPVRVVTVPKTLKSPRIIAIEPCCMQYAQQGLRDFLYKGIETYWLTAGHVNFTDQQTNRDLALISSRSRSFATIDLSDASDRVPLSLVMIMLESSPEFLDCVLACRSSNARLPDGRVIGPLKKFASMGSALCFPIEAMYFYTLCVMALIEARGLSNTPQSVFTVSRDIYVYGDDIIVPTHEADLVLACLQKYNCKANRDKTFVNGCFRESCGLDAALGYEVTPTYIRQLFPKNQRDAKQVISLVASANSFYKRGYWRTTQLIFDQLESVLKFNFPYVAETCSGLGRVSYLGYESIERWNSKLQRFEIKTFVPSPIRCKDKLEGYGALMKFFIGSETEDQSQVSAGFSSRDLKLGPSVEKRDQPLQADSVDKDHLEFSARHGAVKLKLRWIPSH